jgi:predicted SAM-dependent methyltransferase
VLLNVGCGPFGKPEGWINLDLDPLDHVYVPADCRKGLPLADGSCRGVHVEMFLEHLDPFDELGPFLAECHRVTEVGGILRVIVPDAELFIKAYLSEGWESMNRISYAGEDWSKLYPGKMEALNHVFHQGYEHYGGWDFERLERVLKDAGFAVINRRSFQQGDFPEGPIDRELHRLNAIYVEAVR